MSNPLAGLADVFAFHTFAINRVAAGLSGGDWVHRIGETSHAYWLVGHLATCRRAMLRGAGVKVAEEAWEKPFARGGKPSATMEGPAVEQLLADIQLTGPQIVQLMKDLTEADLAKPSGKKLPTGETVWAMLSFMSFHEGYHLGQISLLARSVGKPGLA